MVDIVDLNTKTYDTNTAISNHAGGTFYFSYVILCSHYMFEIFIYPYLYTKTVLCGKMLSNINLYKTIISLDMFGYN